MTLSQFCINLIRSVIDYLDCATRSNSIIFKLPCGIGVAIALKIFIALRSDRSVEKLSCKKGSDAVSRH